MVILKSTVTPGTTDGIVKETLEEKSGLKAGEDFGLAFCPERLAEGSAIKDLETLPIIIGGMNEKSSMVASTFWEALGFKTVPVSSAKTAEMTKLADNLWIDLNIALGNEMAKLSEKLGVNAVEVIEAANTLPKGQHMVNILYPGSGVGGSCLVKDPWFVHHIAKKYGLDLKIPKASREVNDSMPQHMYDMIALSLKETGKEVANSKVAILGIAFKGGTGDTRSTPAKDLIKLLETGNANILAYDPWVEREEAATVTKKMTDSLEEVLKDADCVVIETDHPEFKELDISKIKELGKENVCIIDGRNVFDSKKVKEIGLSYKGIGKGV
jgi:dTDP-alpha-D-glucose dehydrogenase